MERKAVSQNSSRPFSVPQLTIKRARPTQFYRQSIGRYPRMPLQYRLARLDPFFANYEIGSILGGRTNDGHGNGCNPAFTNGI